MHTMKDVDQEFAKLTATLAGLQGLDGADPTDLPDWLTDEEPQEADLPPRRVHRPRHGKQNCPWVGLKPTTHPAVERAAISSGLEAPAMPYLAGRAHDGTALAMVEHAVAELDEMLAGSYISKRRLRALKHRMEAMR